MCCCRLISILCHHNNETKCLYIITNNMCYSINFFIFSTMKYVYNYHLCLPNKIDSLRHIDDKDVSISISSSLRPKQQQTDSYTIFLFVIYSFSVQLNAHIKSIHTPIFNLIYAYVIWFKKHSFLMYYNQNKHVYTTFHRIDVGSVFEFCMN